MDAVSGVSGATKVLFEKEGVYIHDPNAGQPLNVILVGGHIRLVDKAHRILIEWLPTEEPECHLSESDVSGSGNEQGWALVNTTAVGYKASKDAHGSDTVELRRTSPAARRPITCDLVDLKSYKVSHRGRGWPHVTLIQKDGTTLPTFNFHCGGLDSFLKQLNLYLVVKRSKKETGLYLIIDPKIEALQRSFNELQLFPEHSHDIVSKFFRDPYSATLGGFSKVTHFLAETLLHDTSPESRPDDEMVEILHNSLTGLDVSTHLEEHDYEVISASELGALPVVSRGCPLKVEAWTQFLDSEGRINDVPRLLEIVFRGGVDMSIRNEVWKFLLGTYPYDSTYKSRQEMKKKQIDDYFRMKLQWKSMSVDQEKRFSDYRDRKSLVEKDVTRTDRTHPSFAGENNDNVQLLNDILVTYCMHNFDLGYVQGMSDLLSPILVVMENEVDAFWCFANFMERVAHNFEMDQQGMKMQLKQLHTLLCYYDAEMTSYLESRDSDNLYFCFRWLLILFKREFKFPDIMRLWEVLWTDLPCKNFHLLLCLAVLDAEKHTLIENKFGFTEILKRMNDLSQHIPLEETLCKAEGIYLQIKECPNVPHMVREILGLPAAQSVSGNCGCGPGGGGVVESNGEDDEEFHDTIGENEATAKHQHQHHHREQQQQQLNGSVRNAAGDASSSPAPYPDDDVERLYDDSIRQQYL